MVLKPGLYRVAFKTVIGQGTGAAYIGDGKILGGDTAFAYSGNYTEHGDTFNGNIRVFRHSDGEGMISALGTEDAEVEIVGGTDGKHIICNGNRGGLTVSLELLEAA